MSPTCKENNPSLMGDGDSSANTKAILTPSPSQIQQFNKYENEPEPNQPAKLQNCRKPFDRYEYAEAKEANDMPLCRVKLKREGYYTKPSMCELSTTKHCNCLIDGFTVGREGYGEITFLGLTDIQGLNLDEIVSIRRNEVEVYADDYNHKPEIGMELNKPAQITLFKIWPSESLTRDIINGAEDTVLANFIARLRQKTLEMDAVFVDYRPVEGAWVFDVEHFTRYGLQDDFFDENAETLKRLSKKKEPLSKLADDIDFAKDSLKTKIEMKMDTLEISQDVDDSHMEENVDVDRSVAVPLEDDDYTEVEDFLSASHQQSRVANVQPFNLQGMKSSILHDDDDDEDMTAIMKTKKKKTQLFSNKTIFTDSFSESRKSPSPFPIMDLSSTVQTQDPLNSSVFQNLPFTQESEPRGKSTGSKSQKKSHLFQSAVVADATASLLQGEREDEGQSKQHSPEGSLFVKCQNYKMLPYHQSLVFAKTNHLADAGLSHSREFNVRWCNNMNLVHSGDTLTLDNALTKKVTASIFTGNFVPPSSAFGLGNSTVHLEKIEKKSNGDLKKFFEDILETSLSNTLFQPGTSTQLEQLKIKDGVAALADYQAKAASYRLATTSPDIGEFNMQSSVWNLVDALWGKLDDDVNTQYEIHAARRESFSQWLSGIVDSDVQGAISADKVRDEGHLSVIFSLLSANKVREACKVARENKEVRLAFLLSQVSGEYQLKNYMRSQLCLWEERNVDLYMNADRLKLYILLSGMMVWKSIKSSTLINLCENVDWKRALALHLWYHCSPTATINDAFMEYNKAYLGNEMYESYAPHPLPSYISKLGSNAVNTDTKDICYHLISLYCRREHSLAELLTPKTYTSAPLDYHLSWHLSEVLYALGYEHLSEEKHNLLQHSYAVELELIGLWHWAVFVLMHLRDDSRRERCVKEVLNRYCRVSEDEEDVLKLTTEESTLVDRFHVPVQWIHESKALHAKFLGRHFDESVHMMRAGHWNEAHKIVVDHLACDAIIEDDSDLLKGILKDMSLPERCCTIKNWRIGGSVFLDYILLKEKLDAMRLNSDDISSYHLEDMEGEVASLLNRITMLKVNSSRERLCQSEMAKNCLSMQKFVFSYKNGSSGEGEKDDSPRWSSIKMAPYIVNLPLPPDDYLKELRELLGNYATEIEAIDRKT